MEHLIQNIDQNIPGPDKSGYLELLQTLERNSAEGMNSLLQMAAENLKIIRTTLSELKKKVISTPFLNSSDEVIFFKITKPHFHSLLIEWSGIFDLELLRPLGGRGVEEKYFRKRLRHIRDFFKKHSEFFSYYRSGMTHSDEWYFLRIHSDHSEIEESEDLESDVRYTTRRDRLVAHFLGYKRLQLYIENAISQLKIKREKSDSIALHSSLHWTASKAGLVELIYALHSGAVYNHGKADIKAIASQFEQFFHVELTNFYHVFNEIRLRKKSRTPLLDALKAGVLRKMDEMDVR